MTLRFTSYRRPFTTPLDRWTLADRALIEWIGEREDDFSDAMEAFFEVGSIEAMRARAEDADDPDAWLYEEGEEMLALFELVDVVEPGEDAASDVARYTICFFPFGSAYLFRAGTTEELGGACQHYFELLSDDEEAAQLMNDLRDAYNTFERDVHPLDASITFPEL